MRLARKPSTETLVRAKRWLHHMLTAQESDRREGILMRQGQGWFQMASWGHEALAALADVLNPEDYIFPHYRDRSLMLARGVTPEELARDFFARAGSSSEGRNLPGHFSFKHRNVFSIASPIASQCLPAVGAAWGVQQARTDQVVLCALGDAATRQGEFYEAICFAVEKQLPIVFIVEDNGYGISTPTRRMLPFRLEVFDDRFVDRIDGRDVFATYEAGLRAVTKARQGQGPTIVWWEVDRIGAHSASDDQRVYRSEMELETSAAHDPVRTLACSLIDYGALTVDLWETLQNEARRSVAEIYTAAIQQARSSVPPTACLLAEPQPAPVPELSSAKPTITLAEAVNQALAAGLRAIPQMRLFGQDIEDPKGGVFGLTKGLSTQFPERVTNAPLAEATIVGTAVGLAATGFLPVFEVQFVDFLAPGFNQLVSQAATLRWRSNGRWTCPLVLYAPYGAYFTGGGIWHTQSNEGWWAHIPGLRVAVPSTPQDTIGLFWSSFYAQDPCLILLPKHLFRKSVPATAYEVVPFGAAKTVRPGTDVTVVTWGNCVMLCAEAAELAQHANISVEVIDLRSLVPCDWPALETSIRKTGRLVVVQEDTRHCSFGDTIISHVTSNTMFIYNLYSPPRLVSRDDCYVPFCPESASVAVPGTEAVLNAIRLSME